MNNTEVFLEDNFIRKALKDARKSKHLSQKELSDISGLSITTISNIESGDGSPTLRSLILYATAVGYNIQVKRKLD